MPLLLGPVDEVGDDEEVAGVALADDDLGLERRLLRARSPARRSGKRSRRPRLHLLDEPALLVLALGAGEAGHVAPLALGERDLAHLGDEQRVVAGLGQLAPGVAHLGRALEVEVVGVELEPVGVHHRRAGLHAEQGRVGLGVLGAGVVQVVGGDERQLRARGPAGAGPSGPGARCRGRGPSARRRSSRRRRCRGSRRPPAWPRRTARAAAGSGSRRTGSRSWRSGPCRSALSSSRSSRGHLA